MQRLIVEVSQCSSLEGTQVVGRWNNRWRQRVPEFFSEMDERAKILVNSCISEVDKESGREFQSLPVKGMKE